MVDQSRLLGHKGTLTQKLPSQLFVRFVSTERTEGDTGVDLYYDFGDIYIVTMVPDCMINVMSVDTIAFSSNDM